VISLHTTAKMSKRSSSGSCSVKEARPELRRPLEVLRSILLDSDDSSSSSSLTTQTINSLSFRKPTENDIEAYDMESVRAVRTSNLERLRELWSGGKSLDACNPFGESLLHMACRRGNVNVVTFLLCEVKVRSDRCDDFGRNPFHDALWTSFPNTEVVDVLLDHADPSMLMQEDVRGNTPFSYARREHDTTWIGFLEQRREKLKKRKADVAAAAAAAASSSKDNTSEPALSSASSSSKDHVSEQVGPS
jgi:ankyrin repeat protein